MAVSTHTLCEYGFCSKDGVLSSEKKCQEFISSLRRDEFGVGVKLTEDGQRLMEKQKNRLGRDDISQKLIQAMRFVW